LDSRIEGELNFMALEPGAQIGSYEILATMPAAAAESYRAMDKRSNRAVTVKVYPAHISQNPEMKQRLEVEMRTIAALKHPHICAIYDLIHEGSADYLVTEYIEGESLAERLKRGPMDLEEVLKPAIAMVDALDKAHRQGVMHRGLNPSNVILSADGVKLIDFGFAKLVEQQPGAAVSASQVTTRTASAPAASIPPFAAPYLAPEQFDGTEAGERTDIFSFGAVLYEMLTGRPAFEGKTPPILLAAIQTVDPEPVSRLQPAVPPALDYVVRQCLAKDPKQRFQTARDLLSHLQWISQSSAQGGLPAGAVTRRKRKNLLFWVSAAALALVIAALAPSAYRYFQGSPDSGGARFTTVMPGTTNATGGSPVMVSPDGRWIAGARTQPNNGGVYLLPLGSVTPKLLLEGKVIWSFFWSPDSKSFGFFDDGKLKISDVSGSPPQTVGDAPFPIGGASWSKDGIIVFASGLVLHRVQAAGGQPVPITTLDTKLQEIEHLAPNFLPDGRHFLYFALASEPNNSAIYVGSIDSKDRVRLFTSEGPAIYAAPGYVVFNRGNAVFAQSFDAKALKLAGEPFRLSDAALRLAGGTFLSPNETKWANVSVSETGILAYRNAATAAAGPGQQVGAGLLLTWFDRSSQGIERVGTPGMFAGVDLAPDGKRFAVHQHEGEGGDSWFFDAGRMQRLTFDKSQDNSMPVWSHDGAKIAFGSKRNGKWGLYVKSWDGTGPEDLIIESDIPKMPMSWSPDGKLLVYWVNDPKTRGDVWMIPVQGERKPVPLLQTAADETVPQVSPDGKWMAYQSDETGIPQIYVRPFPEGAGNKYQVSAEGGPARWPRWRGDGKELFFDVPPNLMAADIRVTGNSVQPGIPHVLFPRFSSPNAAVHTPEYHRYAVTPDGQRFLIPQQPGPTLAAGGLSGAITNVADLGAAGSLISNVDAVNVVLNWMRDLKRK
jgi:Tol biopolymer transport system component